MRKLPLASFTGALLAATATSAAESPPAPPSAEAAPQRQEMVPARTKAPRPSYDLDSRFFLHNDNFFAWQPGKHNGERVKFQLSIRYDLVSAFERHNLSLSFAYTQKSFWDLFAFKRSSPFVENDYRPELFLSYRPTRQNRATEFSLGVMHESNGLGDDGIIDQTGESRSWNNLFLAGKYAFDPYRLFGATFFYFTLGARAWWVFAPDPPGLEDAVGHGLALLDLDVVNTNHPSVHVSTRVIVREHNVETSLYWPFFALISGGAIRPSVYVQYFYGKAERLIPYNEVSSNFYLGIGFL